MAIKIVDLPSYKMAIFHSYVSLIEGIYWLVVLRVVFRLVYRQIFCVLHVLFVSVHVQLVGGFNHLEKYEFVNGKDDIPYMKWKMKNVWNHQPV